MFERFKVAIERLDPGNPFARYSLLRSLAAYEFTRPYLKEKKILDAACGAGQGLLHLYPSLNKTTTLVGLDISKEALLYAKRNGCEKGISFCCGDLSHIPFKKESFDIVLSFQVVEHLSPGESLQRYFEEIQRLLKPEGLFFLSTLNRDKTSHGLNPFHVKEYRFDEFREMVRRFFPTSEFFGLWASERYLRLRKAEERFGKNFLRFDAFKLRHRIPKPVWEWTYTAGTYLVNAFVTIGHRRLSDALTLQDFHFIQENLDQALDFLAICRKE